MSVTRPGNRLRLLTILAFCTGLALGSFWLLEVMRKGAVDNTPLAKRTDPDYFVEKFNFVRMSKTGEARYNISGSKLTHFPKDDIFEIQDPVLHSLAKEKPPMTMRSERAIVDQDNSRIQMIDKVRMDRAPSATTQRFNLKSDYMLVLPEEDVMRTDKPVDIIFGTGALTGIGMSANNATGEFRVLSRVRGVFLPRPR